MKRLTAVLAAAAIALTGLNPVPARAQEDAAKVLALLLGAAALGHGRRTADLRADDRAYPWRHGKKGRGHDRWRHPPPIPAACVYRIQPYRGEEAAVSARCLRDFGFARLPRDCAFKLPALGERPWVYGVDCLRGYGYRVERARR